MHQHLMNYLVESHFIYQVSQDATTKKEKKDEKMKKWFLLKSF